MGDGRAQRFDDALSSLVENLIPTREDEDDATADERHHEALELAKNIIDEYSSPTFTYRMWSIIISQLQRSLSGFGRPTCCGLDQEEAYVRAVPVYGHCCNMPDF